MWFTDTHCECRVKEVIYVYRQKVEEAFTTSCLDGVSCVVSVCK